MDVAKTNSALLALNSLSSQPYPVRESEVKIRGYLKAKEIVKIFKLIEPGKIVSLFKANISMTLDVSLLAECVFEDEILMEKFKYYCESIAILSVCGQSEYLEVLEKIVNSAICRNLLNKYREILIQCSPTGYSENYNDIADMISSRLGKIPNTLDFIREG